jgi:hypothetical protein
MDEKINLKTIDQYSQEFASAVSSPFFAPKEKISGPEILFLCEIHQINLFVIRELMYSWKGENDKLKSPYFNYQAKEVVDALTSFQNILSNNISISEPDFLPLLTKAVSRTINVILSPYDFYAEALDRQGSGFVHVSNLKSDIRYLRINRAPLEKLVQKLEEKKLTIVQRNETFAMLDSILEEVGFHPEDIEGYVSQFSKVVPLEVEKLYESKPVENTPAVPEVRNPTESPKTESTFNKPAISSVKPPSAAPRAPEKNKKTVAANFQKIVHIKDSLTINQKFMFTKILFHGDFEIFSQAIERLDVLDNFTQAEKYLQSTYPEWDVDSVEYLEFREMLERRFA